MKTTKYIMENIKEQIFKGINENDTNFKTKKFIIEAKDKLSKKMIDKIYSVDENDIFFQAKKSIVKIEAIKAKQLSKF